MFDRLPLSLFMFSVIAAAFLFGIAAEHYQVFPAHELREAKKTLMAIVQELQNDEHQRGEFLRFSDTAIENIKTARIRTFTEASSGEENFLLFGGLNQYLDLCPEHGCLAVEVTPDGSLVHAYPYFPEEIYAANSTKDYPYEYIDFAPLEDTRPIGIERFPNGDLLVAFHSSSSASVYPFGTGVARVDREGRPRWFRFDYSHHWPSPIRGDTLMVPATAVSDEEVAWKWPGGGGFRLDCSGSKVYRDLIRFLGGDGNVIRELPLLDAVLESPYAAVLQHTTNGCDPIHLNFIDVVRHDLPEGIEGMAPGDLVVSFRNISSFGIVDPQSGKLKRLVRGSFFQQHSVQHLSGSRFVIFDNHGGDYEGGPSRVLEVDLATGTEKTVFPRRDHDNDQREVFSREAGHLSVSPDRTRLIVSFSYQGTAFEVHISDGKVLREFRSLHDVSRVEGYPERSHEKAAIFCLYGVAYALH